MGLTSFVRNV